MDNQEIKETPIWTLYQKGRNFHNLTGIYTDTDRNYRMFNGDQWAGAKLGDVEPIQKNFLKPIVKYKLAVIHDNLYAIVYSSLNFQNQAFRKTAERICTMLNNYAARIWEQEQMDYKGREITSDSAINGEGILYCDFDTKNMRPICEVLKKNDVYYGNENDSDIQSQPYILIRKRMPVANAVKFALEKGLPASKKQLIISDNDTFDQSGEAAKVEVDDMVTIIYKLYKDNDTVFYSVATQFVTIAEDIDTGMGIYPLAHMNWERKEGSARSDGEIKYQIPNQIEVNKTEMRRVLTVKSQAYPRIVVDESKIANPDAVNTVGGVIKTKGQTVDDVRKVVGSLPPAQMSGDVKLLQDDLIQMSRELAGAGETATGSVDPESASGRAILAVQQASRAPMTEQRESYKRFIEDVARIWLAYITVHSVNGINLEETVPDERTGQDVVRFVNVPQTALEQLQASVKIDVTPRSVYDRFAQEQTIENLLQSGLLTAQRVGELRIYAELLDDDSVAPKRKILDAVEKIEAEQRKIAEVNARAQAMQQKANMFLSQGPNAQASQISDMQKRARLMKLMQQVMAKKQAAGLPSEQAPEETE